MDYREKIRRLKKIGQAYSSPLDGPSPIPGNNFMTPDVAYVGKLADGLIVELSSGQGMGGDDLYGITFWDTSNPGPLPISCCVDSLNEVSKTIIPHAGLDAKTI